MQQAIKILAQVNSFELDKSAAIEALELLYIRNQISFRVFEAFKILVANCKEKDNPILITE